MSGEKFQERHSRPIRDLPERRLIAQSPRREMRVLPHFCRAGPMHTCDAKDSSDRQKNCHFHLPSTGGFHCMELRFDEYCTNQTLHKYLAGGMNDNRAKVLVKRDKSRLAKIQNKADGYNLDFPLEGEETRDNLRHVWDQLVELGLLDPSFWVDKYGKSVPDHEAWTVSIADIKNGTWCPKRKELIKDILRYFELKEKFGF